MHNDNKLKHRDSSWTLCRHTLLSADSLRLHAVLAEERLRRVQEVSDLRVQFAEKQVSRQTDSADSPVNATAPDYTEIQGAQKNSKTQVTKSGHQTNVNVTETISATPSMSNTKQSVCSASHKLAIIAENEINRGSDEIGRAS